ncbi:MAG: flavin monoamine oxidase family protein, partial [Pseudomonadales bacterium]
MTNLHSRRDFLNLVGSAGGSAAVYQMALALGLTPGRALGSPQLVRPISGASRSVVLLGGGLSSLMSAYELERAGYQCTILEASHRIGGRNLTLRAGDLIDEVGNPRRCRFDDDPALYFNAGAARIPAHHHYLMHYCKELGVALEAFTNVDYNAWLQEDERFGGRPIRFRHFMADAKGFIAELSAKAIDANEFDAALSPEDVERILGFLKRYGDLDVNAIYRGSPRAGFKHPGALAPTPGMIDEGEFVERLDFSEILKSSFWHERLHFHEELDYSAPMMQPVGGMDKIVDGFARHIKSPILTHAQVKSIRLQESGVSVVYQHQGEHLQIQADFCMNCIPKHLLAGIDNNFPNEYLTALAAIHRGGPFKMGIQMGKRFWEDENIYGGISWSSQHIEQIWYPTHNIHGNKGVVLGAYSWGDNADFFTRLNPEQRFEAALHQGQKIHPNYRKYAESFVSIPWYRMNHHLGCTAR